MRVIAVLLVTSISVGLSSGSAEADVDLWPLLELSDEGTTVLYPFFVHEGDFRMVFPFYYRTNEGRDDHVLWPLIKFSDGSLVRAAPVWFRGEQDLTVFPLFRVAPTYTWWTVPPVLYRKDEDERLRLFVAPTFYRETDASGQSTLTRLWPLASHRRDGERREVGFALLAAAEWEPERSYARLWPLLFRSNSPKRQSETVFPVFHRWHDEEGSKGVWLAPFLWEKGVKSPDDGGFALLPIFSYDRSGDATELWAAPYYRDRAPDSRTDVVLPLFWRKESPEDSWGALVPFYGWREQTPSATHERTESSWLMLGAYSRSETFDADGHRVHRNRRFLLFGDELDRNGTRTFRVFGIPIVERMPTR